MFKNQNRLSFSSAVLAMIVLINASILTTAYLYNADFYWALLFSIPALGFAIYYKRAISRSEENDRKKRSVDYDLTETDIGIAIEYTKEKELTTLLGNRQCAQPYQSSIISFECTRSHLSPDPMSGDADFADNNSKNIELVKGQYDHLPINHIWRIGTDYEGCRDHNSRFSTEAFRTTAMHPNVKMIELELNHFDTSSYGSVTGNQFFRLSHHEQHPETEGQPRCRNHTAFGNADSMSIFLDSLRELSERKPLGISLSISDKREFHEMCFAFRKTGITPDYLVIHDGIKQDEFRIEPSEKSGLGLYEALLFGSKTLELYGLEDDIKIIAASEIHSPFDILRLFALGSDVVRIKNHTACTGKHDDDRVQTSAPFSQKSLEHSRSEILTETLNLMKKIGYSSVKEITLAGLLRDVDALYSAGFYKELREDNEDNGVKVKSGKSETSFRRKPYSVTRVGFRERHADFEILN